MTIGERCHICGAIDCAHEWQFPSGFWPICDRCRLVILRSTQSKKSRKVKPVNPRQKLFPFMYEKGQAVGENCLAQRKV